jgi:hypothetical protein
MTKPNSLVVSAGAIALSIVLCHSNCLARPDAGDGRSDDTRAAIGLIEEVDAAARSDSALAGELGRSFDWRPSAMAPVSAYALIRRWIHPDSMKVWPGEVIEPRERPMRPLREVWEDHTATDLERAALLLAALRALGVEARPVVAATETRSESDPVPWVVLIEADMPHAGLDERYEGRRVLDPGCPSCGFGDTRADLFGREARRLERGKLTAFRLRTPGASENRLRHDVTVEMSPPRRVGRPMSPGGFSSPDTSGVVPSMDYSVRQEIEVDGALRGMKIPTMKNIPLSMGIIQIGPRMDSPDLMRGEGTSGTMCRMPGPDGSYRIPDAVVDPAFLLPDRASPADTLLRLPFAFDVATTLTVPLRPSWRLIDLPEPVTFEKPGILFQLTTRVTPDRYVRSLRLRVEKTSFEGTGKRDMAELAKRVRGCSGRMGRILP